MKKKREQMPNGSDHESQLPELFSSKKIYFLNDSYADRKQSGIPNIESDYYPRDETSRRLFNQRDDTYHLDYPSDGFSGCLRKHKNCLSRSLLVLLSIFIIGLLFGSVSYNMTKGNANSLESETNGNWISHYHNFTSSKKKESTSKNLLVPAYDTRGQHRSGDNIAWKDYNEDEMEPIFFELSLIRKSSASDSQTSIADDRNRKKRKRSVKQVGQIPWSMVNFPLEEKWKDIEGKMYEDKNKLKENGRTVFHPFSLTTPSYFSSSQSEELSLEISNENGSKGQARADYGDQSTSRDAMSEMSPGSGSFMTPDLGISVASIDPSVYSDSRERTKQQEPENPTKSSTTPLDFRSSDSDSFSELQPPRSSQTWQRANIHVDGISLADAVKRGQTNGKGAFSSSSRVVGGSSDVRLPTAPDSPKPITLETLKTGQELSFSASAAAQYSFPYQMCLFVNPFFGPKPSIRSPQARTLSFGPLVPLKDDPSRFPAQHNFLSLNINNYANPQPHRQAFHYPTTGPFPFNPLSQAPLFGNAPPPNTPPIFCTYLQSPLLQFPTLPATADFTHRKCTDCNKSVHDQIMPKDKFSTSGQVKHCSGDNVPCRDGSGCIPVGNWCDNEVHCPDLSDEAFCSCRERVARERLCDGYMDCPHGEDEDGCFDCPKSAFSCSSVISPESCIPLEKRCDGIKDCANGNDENDCSALFFRLHENKSYQVSQTSGFLHRNWRGAWYPVCMHVKNDAWAREACLGELGYLPSSVSVNFITIPTYYTGSFIARSDEGTYSLGTHCRGHLTTHVKCPTVKCGTRAEFYNLQEFESRFKRSYTENSQKEKTDSGFSIETLLRNGVERRNASVTDTYRGTSKFVSPEQKARVKKEETGRVVGGRESAPRAWPWAIAIYKDGSFLCGGVILDENWVMTAAHCMEEYWKHFYEIRGGMLRRYSFSAMEQVRTVADVIVHENYNPTIMSNDLALIRLQKPFHFNRWVRPACLPSFQGTIASFFFSPSPGTHCTAVGWGALRERGTDADQLREVEVPILLRCKHKEDLAGAEICAGKAEGGKDTCQGDSGGPLLCKNSRAPLSWYVAGIVSHGEGCARPGEPGAYTRISLFLEWLTVNANEFKLPRVKPLSICPGFRCTSGSKLCIPAKWKCNGFTDCLEAEDEKNCTSDSVYDQYLTQLNFEDFTRRFQMRKNSSHHSSEENVMNSFENFQGKIENANSEIYKYPAYDVHDDIETNEGNTDPTTNLMTITMPATTMTTTEQTTSVLTDEEIQKGESAGVAKERLRQNYELGPHLHSGNIAGTVSTSTVSTVIAEESGEQDEAFSHPLRTRETPTLQFGYPTTPNRDTVKGVHSEFVTNPVARPDANDGNHFRCRHIVQSVLKTYVCDGYQDCEDGSDEKMCNYEHDVKKEDPKPLHSYMTNGPLAGTNSAKCSKFQFLCKAEGKCLSLERKCNGVPECLSGEDEVNCYALSEGDRIDAYDDDDDDDDEEEDFPIEGTGILFVFGRHGWTAACRENLSHSSDSRLAAKVCTDLGWVGYDSYRNVTFTSSCTRFYVVCSKSVATSLEKYQLSDGRYHWPWNAVLYSDGRVVGSAVLLRPDCLLTSSYALKGITLSKNYLSARLGIEGWTTRGYDRAKFIRIDSIVSVPDSDVALLHLSQRVNQTRSIRPIGFPYVFDSDSERDVCVALGNGFVFLRVINNCSESDSFVCYQRTVPRPDGCDPQTWIGVVACQSRVGWYPSSVFVEKEGICGFGEAKYSSLRKKWTLITSLLDGKFQGIPAPPCDGGFRCPDGFCISQKKICQGISNCTLADSERLDEMCRSLRQKKDCKVTQLKCKNGLCISKTNFADGIDDCGDGSDEPPNVTCLEYLRLTAPEKICNGIRNCQDKTDEHYQECPCDESKFKCERSQYCIPQDFVCDGEGDCPDGEDEQFCLGRKALPNANVMGFEIMQRSYGLWHTKCLLLGQQRTSDAICHSLGFNKASLLYEKNQTVLVPQLDAFTWVKLNNFTSLALRSDKPFARLTQVRKLCNVVKCI